MVNKCDISEYYHTFVFYIVTLNSYSITRFVSQDLSMGLLNNTIVSNIVGGKLQPVHIIIIHGNWLMLIFSFQSRMPRNETNLQNTNGRYSIQTSQYIKNYIVHSDIYIIYSFFVQKRRTGRSKKPSSKFNFSKKMCILL